MDSSWRTKGRLPIGSDWRLFAGEAGGGLISKAAYVIGLGRISGFL